MKAKDIQFAELHCLSNYSFLRGASHPEELVIRAHELGYQALALTDECTYSGLVKAHVAAEKLKIKLRLKENNNKTIITHITAFIRLII